MLCGVWWAVIKRRVRLVDPVLIREGFIAVTTKHLMNQVV